MTNHLPTIEDSKLTKYIPPKGEFDLFASEEDYAEKGREWGLFNKNPKFDFWYKGKNYKRKVTIKGYKTYGALDVVIIEFQDGNLSCIHPAYLKEMQGNNFGKEFSDTKEESEVIRDKSKSNNKKGEIVYAKPSENKKVIAKAQAEDIKKEFVENTDYVEAKKTKVEEKNKKQIKKEKLNLPTEKVLFIAEIKEFSTKYNAFTEEDDEVVILNNVEIIGENSMKIGECWAGHSKTLKKIELEIGDKIEFNGKVVEKKFNKEVIYKINNPSKIKKQS